ncbi:MAG TPA: hypothetical protein VFR33_07255 [Candidatus Dormibacteraeota bacterium]|nr:hypothetical protein [Candidatus Dormibacteraeota bacterium]
MNRPVRLLVVVAAVAATAFAGSAPVRADSSGGNAVFVQTNDPSGNAIDAYVRNGDGTLTFTNSYATGGLGGRETGSMSDPLASQGSLRQLPAGLLAGVNAGSDTISVFTVNGDHLQRTQILPSGGPFPTSIAFHGNVLYVLDAGGAGFVSGYRIVGEALQPIPGSTRTLGLANATPPFFLTSPAQVGFTPDGAHLIVTTKTNGTVDVFSVSAGGQLSAAPVKNPAAGVPFAFGFAGGEMVLSFAGTSSLETFLVNADDTITPVSAPVGDGQAALCWITSVRGFEYTSNTGSNDVSQFQVLANGTVALVNPVAASNIPGAIDSASAGGQTLYVQSGLSSTIHVFNVGAGGALTLTQIAAVPDGGSQEGIVVT